MKSLFRALLLAACVAPVAINAQAAEGKKKVSGNAKQSLHDQFTGQGYGLAGCGLGSVVFGPKPGMIQVIAATLNSYGGQLFALTTGTSNCDIPEAGQQAAAFIETNREAFAKDTARGNGETIDGLATILRCPVTAGLGEALRANYSTVNEDGIDSYEKTRRVLQVIDSNSQLKQSCETLG